MRSARHYYAVRYIEATDKAPQRCQVHRFRSSAARYSFVLYGGWPGYKKLRAGDILTTRAKALAAEGHEWPITLELPIP